MKDISSNILDIVHNSIKADSKNIFIDIIICKIKNILEINIKDDGKGMSKDFLNKVTNPYTTTRNTRKVGLGIPLMKFHAEQTDGKFTIESTINKGTSVKVVFTLNHIDRQPLGDLSSYITSLICQFPKIEFHFTYIYDEDVFNINTSEILEIFEGLDIRDPSIQLSLNKFFKSNIKNID